MYKIYNEDCLEGMNRLADGSIDAIVLFAQLPFAVDLINANRKCFRYEWIWEKSLACGFLNANKMPLRAHENILVFYRRLPTYNPQFRTGKPYVKKNHKRRLKETVYSYYTIDNASNDGEHFYPRDVVTFCQPASQVSNDKRGGNHPTQKPTDLLEYLIKTYTNEGELVLDATMGSGSTGVAAINTGRRFIGFETETKFFEIAKRRIDEAIAKREQSLF